MPDFGVMQHVKLKGNGDSLWSFGHIVEYDRTGDQYSYVSLAGAQMWVSPEDLEAL
jgi:hypothetical protein